MTSLKLRAEHKDDIHIMSSVLQDAILRVGEIHYVKSSRSLNLRLTRFRHESRSEERILCGLRVDGVMALQSRAIDRADPEAMAVLLSVGFEPSDTPPGGVLRLIFAGGGEIRIEVECLDIILADVSQPRKTDKLPLHPLGE